MPTATKMSINGALAPPLLAAAAVFVSCLLLPVSIYAANDRLQWEILSSQNFSYQIHLHPHVLLFVIVPWCGEARTLMKELSDQVSDKQYKYASMKLMVVYRNHDEVLAESLGTAEITVIFYRYGIRYKYTGRHGAREILSSARYLMSLMPNGLPLTTLDTSDDLDKFLASTDKAVLLLDSCGWTPSLLVRNNGNETAVGISGGDSGKGLNGEAKDKETMLSAGQKNVEALRREKLKCDIEYGFGGIPWVQEFSPYNEKYATMETDVKLTADSSCTYREYQKFASFFDKFITAARDAFLPPQRQRYGLVSNSSLLSSLGVDSADVWSLIVYYSGCPHCLKVVKDERNLQVALEMHSLPVMELISGDVDTGHAFPIHELSVVLFVDRSARSFEVKRRSIEALAAFRQASLSFQKSVQSTDWLKRQLARTDKGPARTSGDPRSPLSHEIKLKDRMSVMIVNEAAHGTLDNTGSRFQGHSLREILNQLLGQKKQGKLSMLAKEAGFQLLSDDIDINLIESSSLTESQSHSTSTKPLLEDPRESDLNSQSPSLEDHEKQYGVPQGESSMRIKEEEIQDLSETRSLYLNSQELSEAEPHDEYSEKPTYLPTKQVVKQLHQSEEFSASFFFSDGSYQFLESLTSDFKVPRIVIIDPISQMHYVSPQRKDFSSSSISDFINRVSNGSLLPHQRSASLQKTLEAASPPFVNLDFREKNSIPSIAANRFTELVFGSSSLAAQNASNAWNEDVLVLFSNSWCGFCQRMDLVVREVFQSLKGYMDLASSRPKNKKVVISNDSLKAVMLKLPLIYRIDCTWNDCSWILKSVDQREMYPSLLLFPAKRKIALPYDGDMAVNNIINFIAKYGSSSFQLFHQKSDKKDDQNVVKDLSPMANYHKSPDTYKSLSPDQIQQNEARHVQNLLPLVAKKTQYNISPGSILIATDKLSGVNPFSDSKILIISADQGTGFQGLILNKRISQESRAGLGLPELLKETTVFFGGPVVSSELHLTALTKKQLDGQSFEVFPGVYFLDQLATSGEIEKLKAGFGSVNEYRFFLGYSGWGWAQLFGEISEGVWSVEDGNEEDLVVSWP